MKVFADTGFYVARMNPRDQWHRKALKAVRPDVEVYTTSLVINETISLVQSRGYFSTAVEFLRETRANPRLRIIHPDSDLQAQAWDLFVRWGGSGANAVDCLSFAAMQRFSIRRALTFDAHFKIAGFDVLT